MSTPDGCMATGTATESRGDGQGTPGTAAARERVPSAAASVPDTFAALVERFCAEQDELRARLDRARKDNGGHNDGHG